MPETDGSVVGAAGETLAVRTEAHAPDNALVSGESSDLPAALGIPNPNHASGGARQEIAIRAPGDGEESTGCTALRAKLQKIHRGSKEIRRAQASGIQRRSYEARAPETGSTETGSSQLGT